LNTIDYLIGRYGHDALVSMISGASTGTVDLALQQATGLGLSEFETEWAESLARGHAHPEWIKVAHAFDPDAAHAHVLALATPTMEGRQAGSQGAELAAGYISERFAEYGLKSSATMIGGSASDRAPPFVQRFPISYTRHLTVPTLELIGSQGNLLAEMLFRQEFAVLVTSSSRGGRVSGDLVWLGSAKNEEIDLDGKIAVQRSSNDLQAQVHWAIRHNASALILLGKKAGQRSALSKQPLPATGPLSQTLPVLELTRKGGERLLRTGGWMIGDLDSFPPAQDLGIDARVNVVLSEPETVLDANVLGLLPGTDPELSKQVIVVGAHYDHVGDDPDDVRYSGANDNASGVSVLLEIARLWQASGYRPKRSVLFAAWGAQEPGQVGSRHYIGDPLVPLDQTVAVVQLDGVGGGRGYFLEAQSDPEREGLLRFTIQASEAWVDGRLTLTRPSLESDHSPFREAGIPGLLLTWREASDENLANELADPVQPYRLGVTGRMLALTLMALSG
jgi:hypothetical protein